MYNDHTNLLLHFYLFTNCTKRRRYERTYVTIKFLAEVQQINFQESMAVANKSILGHLIRRGADISNRGLMMMMMQVVSTHSGPINPH